MQPTANVITSFDIYHAPRQQMSPFALARRYVDKFNETYDAQFAFAAVKHAANVMLLNPSICLTEQRDQSPSQVDCEPAGKDAK